MEYARADFPHAHRVQNNMLTHRASRRGRLEAERLSCGEVRRLGAVWGGFWASPGSFLEVVGGVLEGLWNVLVVLAGFLRARATDRTPKSAPRAPKSDPESIQEQPKSAQELAQECFWRFTECPGERSESQRAVGQRPRARQHKVTQLLKTFMCLWKQR